MNHIDYDGPGELYISDISVARTEDKGHLDRVVTVCQDSIEDNVSSEQEYHYYCMADGPHNAYGGRHDYEYFKEAANTIYRALRDGERVLVHCHMGQSRSVAVATAALAQLLDMSRHDAYMKIRYYRPQAHPDRLLLQHADRYIEEHTNAPAFTFQGEEPE